ncbi:sulfite exporter TauE/SafE family protein [Zhihengliuella flava]|uniref:Probable membrane transporter protein n=1 Tax=Zhihengliuella flava TaxID=1285193 RepID=A0A931D6U4_9MICC|nr:sulfite exporter TauE/SafE family protein [Zhihengliuella flava]MBG6085514.1 putative membrane protein YfcA [Zhihengliuella flava]
MELGVAAWAFLGAGALLVGLAKTALPGAGTLCVAIFAAVLPARESTGALLVLLLVGDLFAVWMYRHDVDWRTLRRLVPGVLIGMAFGALFLYASTDEAVRRVIGLILLGLLALSIWRRRAPRRTPAADGAAAEPSGLTRYGYGTLGGFTTMVANAGGPVMSLYLLSMRLNVTTFLGTAAYFFFALNLAKLPFQIGFGLLDAHLAATSAALIPLVIVGAFAGRLIAQRIPQKAFEVVVLVLTGVGAINLLI